MIWVRSRKAWRAIFNGARELVERYDWPKSGFEWLIAILLPVACGLLFVIMQISSRL